MRIVVYEDFEIYGSNGEIVCCDAVDDWATSGYEENTGGDVRRSSHANTYLTPDPDCVPGGYAVDDGLDHISNIDEL